VDTNELKLRLFEAKWEWYLDQKMSRLKATTPELEDERLIA